MANLSQFLAPPPKSQGNRPITGKPGSNGYWQRKGFLLPGAYKFIVKQSGKHLFSGMGPGSGGRGDSRNTTARNTSPLTTQGSGGGLSLGEFEMVKGDVVLITVGAAGLGAVETATPTDGGTTTIVCAARGINMVIPGGRYGLANVRPTGGTLLNNIGGNGAPSPNALGGCSSGTLQGDGHRSENGGGAGWGGPPATAAGSGSFDGEPLVYSEYERRRPPPPVGSRDTLWWSFEDFIGSPAANPPGHGAGGPANTASDTIPPNEAGAGGGGGSKSNGGSGSRGGTSFAGGGGGGNLGVSAIGGDGGDGLVTVHWDEVI